VKDSRQMPNGKASHEDVLLRTVSAFLSRR